MGGRFTLSDDSHGIEQVGLNYEKVLACVERAGITELWHIGSTSRSTAAPDPRFPNVQWLSVSVDELKAHRFWQARRLAGPTLGTET